MSIPHSKLAAVCSFTFADGRQCRKGGGHKKRLPLFARGALNCLDFSSLAERSLALCRRRRIRLRHQQQPRAAFQLHALSGRSDH